MTSGKQRFRALITCTLMAVALSLGHATASAMTLAEAAELPSGTVVTIEEAVIVNRTNMILDQSTHASQMFHVRDDTRAAAIFLPTGSTYDINGLLGTLGTGDVVNMTVTVNHYLGLFELTDPVRPASEVATPSIDNTLNPVPVSATDFADFSPTAEGLESRYVVLEDITFTSGVGEPFQYHTYYTAEDNLGNSVKVWMRSQASVYTLNAYFGTVPAGPFDLPGIVLHAFDGNDPPPGVAGEGYMLMPVVVNLPGDLDGDGFVGLADLDAIVNHWNQSVGAGNILSGDANGDGFVGLDDLDMVLGHWNTGTPPATDLSTPEPGIGSMILLSVVGLLNKRRVAST